MGEGGGGRAVKADPMPSEGRQGVNDISNMERPKVADESRKKVAVASRRRHFAISTFARVSMPPQGGDGPTQTPVNSGCYIVRKRGGEAISHRDSYTMW